MPNTPININPIDLQPDVAIGVALPMDSANGSGLQSTYFTKDQVKSNMRNLFSTMIGERVMQPTFGTFLYNLLFEQSTTGLKEKQIRQEVDRAVKTWIPQVEVTRVTFPEVIDNKYITISVEYIIPNYNLEDELTLEIQ
tara:strand:+ start:18486 stop:18902 length:417 start_codon:yes stop_codon:yes gene_type:complete